MESSLKSLTPLALSLLATCGSVSRADVATESPKPLVVCAEPHAMPRTGKTADGKPQGVDLAIAELLARSLGRKLEVHWCASPACSRRCLREGRCDVILGHPHDPDGAKDIAWSVPYAGSQFGLVIARDAKDIRSLADLRGQRVGIVAGTVAISETEHKVGQFKSREQLLHEFHKHKLAAAFVDADFASWQLHQHPKLGLQLVKDYVPREHWNMALAVRIKSVDLLTDLNKALAELSESGQIRKVYAAQGVAYRPPFTSNARRKTSFNTWKRIQERGVMAVSLDPANLPYSSAKTERAGFDVELLRALAREMGVKLRIDWLDIHRATAIGKLLDGASDLAFGTPIDDNAVEDDDDLGGKLLFSRPYYGTGYLLVTRKDGPPIKSLSDLKGEKARRLGAEAGSVADYRLRQRGYLRSLYRNQLAVLKAMHDGGIDYGYLWANVGWTLHTSPDLAVKLAAGYVPEDHWNIAIAMRHGDEELKKHVDAALTKLIKDGTVAKTLARYHVPYFAPFPDDKKDKGGSKDAEARVIKHPAIERGLEPQMQRVQGSKNPYSGLERVRSAGVLVVGLDQRNLPFSTAHPRPAGLDYEIAGLLAKKLGVSLRIYWGYSSHASYPSRLATRKLCDVMLGVMPDDRFAKRVLYSMPYYKATYCLVVREGDRPPATSWDQPVAIEEGAAVRGLPEKAMLRPYPSLDAVLEAVANGKAKAGCVISTRSQWLAQQKWPGKLRFVGIASADRFPICAVVRKADGDLRDAIDRAFAELAQSAELADVFARWHVPDRASHTNEKLPR
ncbi:MAG: transporter substrate-binding domain-containing protein [Planctomycetes bacterium]|nr:transporter substrate-binding domain-containing protein [Planctomycetota bacterium]